MPTIRTARPRWAIAVIAALGVALVANAASFGSIEDRIFTSWRAIAPTGADTVERSSFAMGRYGVYFALGEYAPRSEFVTSSDFRGNVRVRLYGLARAESIRVVPFDSVSIANELSIDEHIVSEGFYADDRGWYQLAIADGEPATIVHLELAQFEWLLVDARLLPSEVREELAP